MEESSVEAWLLLQMALFAICVCACVVFFLTVWAAENILAKHLKKRKKEEENSICFHGLIKMIMADDDNEDFSLSLLHVSLFKACLKKSLLFILL